MFFEVDVQNCEKLHELHNNLLFLPEKMKIEKVENFLANFYDKKYVIYITNLYQALNYRLVLKKVHKTIKFNKKLG